MAASLLEPLASSTSSGCGTSGTLRGRSTMCPDPPKRPLRGAFKPIRVLQADFGDVALCVRLSDISATSPKCPGTPRGPKNPTPSETRTDKATSPKCPTEPRSGASPPKYRKAAARGLGDGLGKGGQRLHAAAPREGARPGSPPPKGWDPGGKDSQPPRQARGRAPRPAGG